MTYERRNAGPQIILFVLVACCATSAVAAPFIAVHDIQYTLLPDGASPYSGQSVETGGVVTAVYPSGFVIQDGPSAPWSGVWVYDPVHRPEPGDSLIVTAIVDEYFGLTELGTVSGYQVLARGCAVPDAAGVAAAAIATGSPSAESWEGVLVRLSGVEVVQPAGTDGSWSVDDGSGQAWVGDNVDYQYIARTSDALQHVTGVVLYSWNEFRLQPRDDEDIERVVTPRFALRGSIITPSGVMVDGYVVVAGRRIESVGTTPPALPVVDTGGVICPGLIDAHDHPAYNVFPRLEFGQTFANRYQWQSDPDYLALRAIYNGMVSQGLLPRMWKYSEARAVTWGSASVQGAFPDTDWDAYAHARFLARNPERFPGRIYTSIFPMNLSASTRARIKSQIAGGVYRSVVIHLSEGIDASSLAEFDTWVGWGMLDSTTVVIHGIPYGPLQFNLMAQAGAALVVSPRSELELYGTTANVPAAMAAGVPVSLGVDWCVSGSQGMLQELAVTDSLNVAAWGGVITDRELVDMVTLNPARAFGRGHDLGRIAAGYLADFTVVSPRGSSAYRALIEATPNDVRLVMVEGHAIYGTAALMEQLSDDDTLDPYYLCDGVARRIDFVLDDNGVPLSAQTLAATEDQLQAAYANLLLLTPCVSTGVAGGPAPRLSLLVRAGPVPSSGRFDIEIERLTRGDDALRVVVYDVAGRRVRTLMDAAFQGPGRRRLAWDGSDERGTRVAAGVYFLQAISGNERVVRRVVLVR